MLKRLFIYIFVATLSTTACYAQKKEIAQAKSNIKAGKSLVEAEGSMRKLLADSANRHNEKIWLVLFDAVKKQYEAVNEQMYLKQSADTSKLFCLTNNMFGVLEGLDSIDAMPDGSGQVKLKYRRKHSEYLNAYRKNLYNGGLYFMSKQDYVRAYTMFNSYVDCACQPLFEGFDYASKDSWLPKASFYAMYNAFKNGDGDATLSHAELARKDTAHLLLTYQCVAETYRMRCDTAAYVATLVDGFNKQPLSKYFFPHLFDVRFNSGDLKAAFEMCNRALECDSTDVVTLLAKSTVCLAMERYAECVTLCDRIIATDVSLADAYLNAGLAYFNQAVHLDKQPKHTREQRKQMATLYRQSLPYMQTYRKLAPTRKDLWAMPLYTIYLNLNMGKEFEEMDAIMKQKN